MGDVREAVVSTEEDGISSAFISLDRLLKDVTSEAVATALVDFPLQLGIQRDFEWLAMATRRALATAHRDLSDGPDRISSSDVRSQLEKLAINTDKTWRELFGRDSAVDDHLWNYALRHWDGAGGTDVGDGNIVGEPPMMARFNAAVQELDVLASFLRDAAKEIETQRGPWRGSEQRRLRIERAQYLAPVLKQLLVSRFQQITTQANPRVLVQPLSWTFISAWWHWHSTSKPHLTCLVW
jgi:hypothetical protein